MACQNDFSIPSEIMEQIAREGLDCLPDLIRVMINTAMYAEHQAYLGAGRYERREYANGYKGKTIKIRVRDITLAVPQVREGGFLRQALEKGLRSELERQQRLGSSGKQGCGCPG